MEVGPEQRYTLSIGLITLGLIIGLLSGCGHQRVRANYKSGLSQLEFIQIGKNKRQEFYDRLGAPISEFENRRIIIYMLVSDAYGRLKTVTTSTDSRSDEIYNLVLVFGAGGVLERTNLIRVR